VSMLAMDVMTWNWDGYGMNRNNYRVYHDPRSDKVVFFPGGMDQMFWEPQGAIFPPMKGLVARSLLETPQGRKLYYDRMIALLTNVFRIAVLTNRLEELRQAIRPLVAAGDPDAARILDHSAVSLSQAIIRRAASIGEQLKRPPEPLLIFNSAGEASLSGWREHNPSNAAALDRVSDHSGAMLHIRVGRHSIP